MTAVSIFTPNIRRLLVVSFPLIFANIFETLMLLVDRLLLAQYSVDAMNAASVAGTCYHVFLSGATAIATITAVFVGHYNGAKQFNRVGEPVWQMIWFSLFSLFVFVPIAIWGGPYLIPVRLHQDGLCYFQLILAFGFAPTLVVVLSMFFVGRGYTTFVTLTVLLGCVLNGFFDYLLIFGVHGFVKPLGATGAAIGTILAQLIQVTLLGCVFLNYKNKLTFNTHDYRFNVKAFYECLKIGAPSSLSHVLEHTAWAVLLQIVAHVDTYYLTILDANKN